MIAPGHKSDKSIEVKRETKVTSLLKVIFLVWIYKCTNQWIYKCTNQRIYKCTNQLYLKMHLLRHGTELRCEDKSVNCAQGLQIHNHMAGQNIDIKIRHFLKQQILHIIS